MDILGQQPVEPISLAGFWHTLITAAENCHAPAAGLECASKFLHHWRFARSADREISDADDETTERALAKNSFPIQIKPELDDSFVNKRERVKNSAQNRGAKSAAPLKHHVDSELL